MTAGRGLTRLAGRLHELAEFVAGDQAAFEAAFGALPRDPRLVGRTARHLLDLGGKRLRPMCVQLAARLGSSSAEVVIDLGVAVELVHSATLLHDDVVDLGESRRGAPTARRVYGNAASIFAGDWLLIEALRRVQRCRLPGLMEELLDTIEEMIFAESIQLENRGSVRLSRDDYFRVVEGKTASVFRWAMSAGARAAGLDEPCRRALETYGLHLGVAFQAVDDLLDLTGDEARTGKALFTDLREGKMTYPVILGLERDPALLPLVESIIDAGDGAPSAALCARLIRALRDADAMRDCLALARQRAAHATRSLEALPPGRARRALATVAEAIVDRDL
ncbi:MAG: polyprenyl synthetase family protein [Acidobacteria bacterium]|nr:MAG: polyprenyl synthetase family protein [Acidobacteriota bacterium]